jgi:hypothetical protein
MMTDTQLIHKANGVKRIKQAISNCDLPVSEVGTMFTKKYTHIDLLQFERYVHLEMLNAIVSDITTNAPYN